MSKTHQKLLTSTINKKVSVMSNKPTIADLRKRNGELVTLSEVTKVFFKEGPFPKHRRALKRKATENVARIAI